MKTTAYQMAINNTARYIRKHPVGIMGCIDAFTASSVLSAAFCKNKEEIVVDIVNAGKNEDEWANSGG